MSDFKVQSGAVRFWMITQDSHCASLSHECMSVLSISSSSFPVGQGSLGRFWKLPREPAKRQGL